MPVYDYPNRVFSSPATDTWVSAGLATLMMAQLSIAQTRLREAMFGFSTLASYLAVGQNSQGLVSNIYHSNLAGILPSNHHNQFHNSQHYSGASDALPYATAAGYGLMSAGAYNKVESIEAKSTRNDFTISTYVGSTVVSQVISVGYQPMFVKILQAGSTGSSWEWIYGANKYSKHLQGTGHQYGSALTLITSNANGFKVLGSCNVTNVVYWYWASREY